MKKIALVFILCVLSSFIFAQSTQSEIDKLNQDLHHLKEVIYSSHPRTFTYTSRDSFDALFTSLEFKENDEATTLELERRVRTIVSRIGCGHTSLQNTVFKPDTLIMPFSFFCKEDKVWIKKDFVDSPSLMSEYRVLSINGNETSKMIDKMLDYRSADGYSKTFKYRYLNYKNNFSLVYQYYFDQDSARTYVLLSPELDTIVVKHKNIQKIKEIKDKKENPNVIQYGSYVSLELDSIHDLAIMKINSFASFFPVIGTAIDKHRFKKVLRKVKKEGYHSLVIDLRNNLGGSGPSGNAFASLFVDEQHSFDVERHNGKIFKYATFPSKLVFGINFFLGNLFAQRRLTFKYGKTKSIVRKNKHNHFDGQLYVIINGFTASTGSMVASTLKYKSNAILIGEETATGENNLNGYYFPKIKLPYSKIKIQIPLYRIDMNFTEDMGYGLLPDVPVQYDVYDVIDNKDLEMERVLKMNSNGISLKRKELASSLVTE